MTGLDSSTPSVPPRFAAVVLAGGAARRMGGADKPALPVGGRPMLDRVLAAVADADPRIVVGPAGDLPAGTLTTREQPPGGGPVAALAAGLTLLPDTPARGGTATDTGIVALLAADLPLLTTDAVRRLRTTLLRVAEADGVVYVDDDGRGQFLCGAWRVAPLRAALHRLAAGRDGVLTGTSMRALVAELTVSTVGWQGAGPPPWFDCDTEDDVRRAEEWIR
ncbi:molybdenum cofactor guanylyltransferase [Plantactinospora sp. WMMB782]|uniref:molybdenum cofactor guanylyltransferase n=1 Tax=Plantactinospora sp. WMMB782 TaxID=3404121 RepID=UPI003B92EC7F